MKALLLIVFSISLSLSSSAQKIHFTDTSNVWKELFVNTTDPIPVFSYYTYGFSNDTIIASIKYKSFSFQSNFGTGLSFVREDTLLRKVYIRDMTNDSDIVLMDYNLNAGDTFKIYNPDFYPTPFTYIVDSVDSTLINAVWHKVWHFSRDIGIGFSPWTEVIEGIGCIDHPTYMLNQIGIQGEYAYYMYCFSNNGITPPLSPQVEWLDNTTSCTTFPTLNVNQLQTNHNQISIYPNPTTNSLTITSSQNISTLSISNLLGQTIYTKQYNVPQIQVDVSSFPPGIYFAKVNGTEVQKFVKQ